MHHSQCPIKFFGHRMFTGNDNLIGITIAPQQIPKGIPIRTVPFGKLKSNADALVQLINIFTIRQIQMYDFHDFPSFRL